MEKKAKLIIYILIIAILTVALVRLIAPNEPFQGIQEFVSKVRDDLEGDSYVNSYEYTAYTGNGISYTGIYTGTITKGKPNGNGTFESILPDDVNFGAFAGINPESGSKMTIQCNSWIDGYAQGSAKFTFAHSGTYDGQVKDTLFDGEGTIWYKLGEGVSTGKFEGMFSLGKREGAGTRTYNVIFGSASDGVWSSWRTFSLWDSSSWKYEGDFINGNPTANGMFTYNSSGTIYYQGEYVNDLPNGYGIMYFTNDNNIKRVEGWFTDAKPTDSIIVYYTNGNIYHGEVSDNFTAHGNGITYYQDGVRHEGGYRNGKYSGYGALYYPNGNWYEGDFPGVGTLHINGLTRTGTATLTDEGWHFKQQ